MATISAILQLVNLVQGESSYGDDTNWGDVTDRNFSRLEKALGEATAKTLTGSDVLLTADEELSSLILLSGALVANVAVETSGRKGFWMVKNACTGDYTVTFKTDAGAGVIIPQGGSALVTSNGTDIVPITLTRASGAGARTKYALKASGYTAVPSDDGAFFECSATLTLAFKPAALLGDQWVCLVMANGGAVTINPDASELINGATTLVIPDGSFAIVVCTGTAFRAVVLSNGDVTLTGTQTLTNKTLTSPTITGGSWTGGTDLAIADGGTGASTPANAFTALKQAATDTATGVVELATAAEVATGTDTARVPSVATMKNHQGIAIAWVNFNGTGTVAIRDSYNVSSITDNGTGDYTINFASALTNTNYCPVFGQISNGASGPIVNTGVAAASLTSAPTTKTTSALRINTGATNAPGLYDLAEIYAAILGD